MTTLEKEKIKGPSEPPSSSFRDLNSHRQQEVCMTKQSWSKCGPVRHCSMRVCLQSLLQDGLTTWQNSVTSLPKRQGRPLSGTRHWLFPSPILRLPGKHQLLMVPYLKSLEPKGGAHVWPEHIFTPPRSLEAGGLASYPSPKVC